MSLRKCHEIVVDAAFCSFAKSRTKVRELVPLDAYTHVDVRDDRRMDVHIVLFLSFLFFFSLIKVVARFYPLRASVYHLFMCLCIYILLVGVACICISSLY